jgi:hypothetical protein
MNFKVVIKIIMGTLIILHFYSTLLFPVVMENQLKSCLRKANTIETFRPVAREMYVIVLFSFAALLSAGMK